MSGDVYHFYDCGCVIVEGNIPKAPVKCLTHNEPKATHMRFDNKWATSEQIAIICLLKRIERIERREWLFQK